MKFVYITDVHFRETTPVNRKDTDVIITLTNKFIKLKKFCLDNNVDFIVHGGDLGHYWDWKSPLINKVDKILRDLGIPFYTVIGNHDVPAKAISEYKESGLIVLEKLGSVKIIGPTKTSIGPYDFYGYHADTLECEEALKGKVPVLDPTRVSVAVCHASVGKTGLGHEIHYKKVDIRGFDFAFFGDIHSGFPVWKNPYGVTLGNPGTFFRQTLAEAKQPVGFYLVEDKDISFHELEPASKDLFKIKAKLNTVFQSTKQIKELTKVKINDYKLFDKIGRQLKLSKKLTDTYYQEYTKEN